jgi:hypothetical protein
MRNDRNVQLLKWCSTALTAALACGCGSDSRPVKAPPVQAQTVQAESTARTSSAMVPSPSLAQLKGELVQGNADIDKVLGTLHMLTDPQTPPSELRPTYDAYSDQLARMTQRSAQVRRDAEQMRDSRDAYFAKWEEKAATIDNPSVRASAEARKSRLRAAHERITTNALAARDAYEPFMRDLQDVRKYLASELSPTSVQMLGDVSKKADADGAVVKQRVNAVIRDLDAVESADGDSGGAVR